MVSLSNSRPTLCMHGSHHEHLAANSTYTWGTTQRLQQPMTALDNRLVAELAPPSRFVQPLPAGSISRHVQPWNRNLGPQNLLRIHLCLSIQPLCHPSLCILSRHVCFHVSCETSSAYTGSWLPVRECSGFVRNTTRRHLPIENAIRQPKKNTAPKQHLLVYVLSRYAPWKHV